MMFTLSDGAMFVFLGIDTSGRLMGFPWTGGMPRAFSPEDVTFLPLAPPTGEAPEISGPDAPVLTTQAPHDSEQVLAIERSQMRGKKR